MSSRDRGPRRRHGDADVSGSGHRDPPNPPNYIFGGNGLGIVVTNSGSELSGNDFFDPSVGPGARRPELAGSLLARSDVPGVVRRSRGCSRHLALEGAALTQWTDANATTQFFTNVPDGTGRVRIGEVVITLAIPEPSGLVLGGRPDSSACLSRRQEAPVRPGLLGLPPSVCRDPDETADSPREARPRAEGRQEAREQGENGGYCAFDEPPRHRPMLRSASHVGCVQPTIIVSATRDYGWWVAHTLLEIGLHILFPSTGVSSMRRRGNTAASPVSRCLFSTLGLFKRMWGIFFLG